MLDASGPLRRSASSVSAWSKLAALSATLVAATALAEPPATTPQPEQPTAPAPAPTAPPVAGPAANDYISQAMVLDASNDRGLIASHAGVVGDGNWTINSYELIGIGATRGFSDRAQVSVTTLLPIVSGMPLPVLLQGKYVLFQNPATQVSAMVNLSFIRDTVTTFGAGGVESSYAFTRRVRSEFTRDCMVRQWLS